MFAAGARAACNVLSAVDGQTGELRGTVEEHRTRSTRAQDDLSTPGWDTEPMAVLARRRKGVAGGGRGGASAEGGMRQRDMEADVEDALRPQWYVTASTGGKPRGGAAPRWREAGSASETHNGSSWALRADTIFRECAKSAMRLPAAPPRGGARAERRRYRGPHAECPR